MGYPRHGNESLIGYAGMPKMTSSYISSSLSEKIFVEIRIAFDHMITKGGLNK